MSTFPKISAGSSSKMKFSRWSCKTKRKHGGRNVSVSDAHCWRMEQKQKEEVVQCCSRDVITVILSSRTTVWNYRADPLWSCSELRVGITRAFLLLAAGQWAETTKELQRDEGRTDGREGQRMNSWRREEGRSRRRRNMHSCITLNDRWSAARQQVP